MQAVEEQITTIRQCAHDPSREDELEAVKARLVELIKGPGGGKVKDLIEGALKGELLEVRWELEDILEAAAPPPPAPEPEPEPEPAATHVPEADPQDEMVMVYDDPRGLVLHRTTDGTRWFATQVDPNTGQPATFELPPEQIAAVQQQLAGSPYWVVGTGA